MRKSPPGKILPGAHQVEREARILAALNKVNFQVPNVIHLCNDESVVGSKFYLMELVDGVIYKDAKLPTCLDPSERRNIYLNMMRTLALLHSIDPNSIYLQNYGYSSNYCGRQVKVWTSQYRSSSKTTHYSVEPMETLANWLSMNIPDVDSSGYYCGSQFPNARIVHGDFRLDNIGKYIL